MTTMPPPTRRVTTPAAHDTDWMLDGLCREVDSQIFFPEGRGGAVALQIGEAKRVCSWCPVKATCLEWSVETGQSAGVWGGLSEDERRVVLRERAGQRKSSYARCIDEQEYIEEEVAKGVSHRDIGKELGVCHSAVGKAWRFFEAERVKNAEAVNAA